MRELYQEDGDDLTLPLPPSGRLHRWLALAAEHPPEWLAAVVESPTAKWVVVSEDGPEADRQRYVAYLNDLDDLPYWAFALAKGYLDDVGEWPLFGLPVEEALNALEEHGDPLRAVREILAGIKPVWPDFRVMHVGRESD
ncbi:hypothetical protein SIID45300_01835 [Candidatus Magnetaquicoccaceae bacterium FCR-1]|uniref:Uncharacterized protein n=1 Tax=Candidatus Magnetaquiglobus chichijimensis TaxID=3141448 RepID=A0ABQ0C9F0_9PROT